MLTGRQPWWFVFQRTSQHVHCCADAKLLEGKKYRDLIEPYDQRTKKVQAFVQTANSRLEVNMMRLEDPHIPTRAETDPDIAAIVVSEETLPGAVRINAGRAKLGFHPLAIVVVPVIGAVGSDEDKLSSTRLRAEDAKRL
jgi:pantetheine-phosphate adenylyltransferase